MPDLPRILLAPDKFKGSLDADQVARALAAGIEAADPPARAICCPIADGGEGTVAAALAAGWQERTVTVEGPTGGAVNASYAVRDTAAVVELAQSSGLQLLPGGERAPLVASTFGLGQTIAAAIDDGATSVMVGLGGSASTDGGAGLLQALGAQLLDESGRQLERGGADLANLAHLDLTDARTRVASVSLIAACDVTNPLLGPTGAAKTFGPQKGAEDHDLAILETGLTALADAVRATGGPDLALVEGAGAAGGAGFGLLTLGATFRPGIDVVAEFTGLVDLISDADLVVVGEGRLDSQSLAGKGPVGVAHLARSKGVSVVAVVGQCDLDPAQLEEAGLDAVYALTDLEPDLTRSTTHAAELLQVLGTRLAARSHRRS